MKKYKLSITIFILAAAIMFLYNRFANSANIHINTVNHFMEGTEKSKQRAQKKILKNVIRATGIKGVYLNIEKNLDKLTLDIKTGEVYDGDAIILTVKAEESKYLVAVYEKNGENYRFLGLVDTFFEITDLQIMPLKERVGSIILVKEKSNQPYLSFEEATYARAYIFDGDRFRPVLNIMLDYNSYYNEKWNDSLKRTGRWFRVTEKVAVEWQNEMYPIINTFLQQSVLVSQFTEKTDLPPVGDFNVFKTREIKNSYYWSSKWSHFILSEGVDVRNGQKVAIVDDYSQTPYFLTGDFNEDEKNFLVKYKNGIIETVNSENIRIQE